MSPDSSRQRALLVALAVLFFGSGASALVYQVLWLRMLGWVFGVTVHAAAAVWATFMAGLAIGSFAAGRIADRVRNPFRWFGATELLIGVTAVASPWLLERLQQVYVAVYPSLPETLAAVTLARLAIAVAVLIVPTALMGATLPLVLKTSTFQSSGLGAQVGLLYGSNAAGAIVGTLASGLYFIPGLGIRRTFLVAAGVNALVGLSAMALSRFTLATGERPAPKAEPDSEPAAAGTGRRARVVLAVFTLSGAVSLALETVWFRVLTLFLRPTVYSFSLMLATILGGIALGSYLIAPVLGRRGRWLTILAALELAIGIAIVLSFHPLNQLNALTRQLSGLDRVMPGYLVYPLAGSLLAILPSALLMGIAFPIGLRVWASTGTGRAHTAERIGLFYSLNVSGAIVGSLAGGFFLLPRLGSETALQLLGALSFAAGVALLFVADSGRAVRAALGVTASAVFASALLNANDPFAEFIAQRYRGMGAIWKQEGVEATVVVHQVGEPGSERLMMTINGNHQAGSDHQTVLTHRRIGHLPMIVHPSPRTALVIGLGGGATAGAVSIADDVHVDIVELSESVINGAKFFGPVNYDVVNRRNATLRVDDGRNYMMLTKKRYDVITADVIQPIFVGAGNIYSREYFELMKQTLAPGGVVLQWIPGTEAEYKLIGRTFLSVFPHTTAWMDGSLFLGSLEPITLSRKNFDARLGLPGRAQALRDIGVESFDALLKQFVAGPDELRAFVGDGPLLTDDRPLAEYFLSLPRDRNPDLGQLKGEVGRYVVD